MKVLNVVVSIGLAFCVIGCTPKNQQILGTDQSQVALRQIQTRAFDTTDRAKMLRTIIATLQDLGFVIDDANYDLGSVSATKLDGYALRMTVTIRPRGSRQLLVRANAQYNATTVDDPLPYQNFFTALEKSLFLTAQQVD